ncbi:IS3 family transposase [Streptomyces sp. NPDC005774]|uniref:IS3 family transposase n=1 Tax=Streptomyces sp. NPDC005774 TaxID=3364728 RepID=UPI0036AD18AF
MLTERIRQIHTDSGGIHGSPRVHAVLRREGVAVGRKRVERLMREADLVGISARRKGFTRRDPKAMLAPDLVQRDFTAPAPNRLWVTDLTMTSTGEGPLWLSAIRDAFPRREKSLVNTYTWITEPMLRRPVECGQVSTIPTPARPSGSCVGARTSPAESSPSSVST